MAEPSPAAGKIAVAGYDPHWPEVFARQAERIRAALGADDGIALIEPDESSAELSGGNAQPISAASSELDQAFAQSPATSPQPNPVVVGLPTKNSASSEPATPESKAAASRG